MSTLSFSEIEKAAVQQEWVVERTGRQHRRLVPPDKTQEIVVTSGTPSDQRAVKNFLSKMKRSGFVWPWPPLNYERPGRHDWRNDQNGHLTVTLGDVISDEVRDACLGVVKAKMNEETGKGSVVTSVVKEVGPEQLNGVGPPPAITDADGVLWAKAVIPDRFNVIDGYSVSVKGDCRSPKGLLLRTAVNGNQVYVSMMRENGKSVSIRVDRLVLWTFAGEPGFNELDEPVHSDKNPRNVALTNLRWRLTTDQGSDVASRPIKKRRVRKPSTKLSEQVKTAKKRGFTPVDEDLTLPDDEVSVALVFTSHDVTLQFTKGSWSISPCTDLRDDQVKAIGSMIDRWLSVHDNVKP